MSMSLPSRILFFHNLLKSRNFNTRFFSRQLNSFQIDLNCNIISSNQNLRKNQCIGFSNSYTKLNFHSTLECFKSKKEKKTKKYDDDDDDDDDGMTGIEDEEEGLDTNSKVMTLSVGSLRTDMVLRSTFQIARNKIEKLFYESRIRVNGYKIYKKGHNVSLGDEIDIVKSFSPTNSKFLLVQRVKILAASDRDNDDEEGKLKLKVRRFKNLTINNYEENPYKESNTDSKD